MELANDFVLPADRRKIDSPWPLVYHGILTQALMDLSSPDQNIYNDAYRWLVDLRSTSPTGMQNCCDVLGLSATFMSQAVRDGARMPAFARPKNGGATWKVGGKMLVRGKAW